MNTKPPKKIKILAAQYTLRFVDQEHFGGEELWGDCLIGARVIRLDNRQEGADLHDTVLHEILHALFAALTLRLDADDTMNYEERVVTNLATSWTTILIDNPKLRTWMTELLT